MTASRESVPDPVLARYARWEGVGRGFTVATTTLADPPGPGEVLVRVDLATVCGSDLHTTGGHRPGPAPSVLGHEQVGTVVAVGPQAPACVDGTPPAVGDRVVWSVTASCGRCEECDRCAAAMPQKCRRLFKYGHEPLDPDRPLAGGFATHCLLRPGTALARVPVEIPDEVASPASCATATVAAALAAGPAALQGRRVLVTGAGMLGLTAAAMAARAGAEVTVSDPGPARRERATRFGASATVEPGVDVGEVDLALEMSGSPAAVRACVDGLAVGGTAVLVGPVSPGPRVEVDPEALVRGLRTLTGVHNYRPADLASAVDFLAAAHRDHPFAELVGGRHRLDDLDGALAAARAGGPPRRGVAPGA